MQMDSIRDPLRRNGFGHSSSHMGVIFTPKEESRSTLLYNFPGSLELQQEFEQ